MTWRRPWPSIASCHCPLPFPHALAVATLPPIHSDPFEPAAHRPGPPTKDSNSSAVTSTSPSYGTPQHRGLSQSCSSLLHELRTVDSHQQKAASRRPFTKGRATPALFSSEEPAATVTQNQGSL